MSNLSEFLQAHESLGYAYTPVMTLYIFAVICPIWSAYLLICAAMSAAPAERFPIVHNLRVLGRVSLDAIFNPVALTLYYYGLPYFLNKSTWLTYFFYTNGLGNISIHPWAYFITIYIGYVLWYELNKNLFKRIKPSIVFDTEYHWSFTSPSRIFGAAGLLLVFFDFEASIAYLLWTNVAVGFLLATIGYLLSVYHTVKTSHYLLTNR
jgi:hypothetical protein